MGSVLFVLGILAFYICALQVYAKLDAKRSCLVRTLLAFVLLLSIIARLAGCLSGRPLGDVKATAAEPSALGSFTVSSQVLGNQIFTPSVCTAGDREFFLGADFESQDSNLIVRLVVDPLDGP